MFLLMKLVIDAKELLKEASKKSDRKATTLWLSESVYKEFQADCGDVAPSNIIEMLMRKFSESNRETSEKGR